MSFEDRLYNLLPVYERLPYPLRHAAGVAYRRLPVRWRLGARYGEFRRLAEAAEGWTPAQVQEYQLEQLRLVLRHAAAHCPLYRERFERAGFDALRFSGFEDFARCPQLTKADLIERREELVSRAVPSSERLCITTGGSTGVPVGFYLQKGVSRPKERAFLAAHWGRRGFWEGARLVVIRGHVTSDRAAGRIASYDATRDWLMLSSYHMTAERLPEYIDAIERFRPDVLHAYPSAALQLAELLERVGQSWRAPLRCLLAGSERLELPQKRLLERVFGCAVYRWYGHSERAVLAGEGRTSESFYFHPAYGFAEFGQPDADGYREVIATSFHNLAMPLIRYRTGDFVRIAEAPRDRPAEWHWPALREIAGREQEFLVSRSGRKISLTAFNMHDDVFDELYAVQFVQAAPGRVEFRYVPGARFQPSRLPELERRIRRKLGDDFELELRAVGETERAPSGKHRWLVSQLVL